MQPPMKPDSASVSDEGWRRRGRWIAAATIACAVTLLLLLAVRSSVRPLYESSRMLRIDVTGARAFEGLAARFQRPDLAAAGSDPEAVARAQASLIESTAFSPTAP